MSCDYAVWNTTKRFTHDEAGEVNRRLCEGDLRDVEPSPKIAAFYAELTALHPELDTIPEDRIDDADYCPWSCRLDRSEAHVLMSCAWSTGEKVGRTIEGLAKKHRLVFYDPQNGRVAYPPNLPPEREMDASPPPEEKAKPWWKIW